MKIKRILRRVTGFAEVLQNAVPRGGDRQAACIFYYHRVADLTFSDGKFDDRNVSPAKFEEHVAALREHADIVPLPLLPERLAEGRNRDSKPLVALTFDDGYANFLSEVLPILKHYDAPATLSVATGYVGTTKPAPFDRWAHKNFAKIPEKTWRMLNWDELEKCVSSDLVTLGSHSEFHLKASESTPLQIKDEVGISADKLRSRFGIEHCKVYAYPYGNSLLGHVPATYEQAVADAGFSLAVTTDVGTVSAKDNPFRLARLEAHDLDSPATIKAKTNGAIAPLYLNEWYHRAAAFKKIGRKFPSQTSISEV